MSDMLGLNRILVHSSNLSLLSKRHAGSGGHFREQDTGTHSGMRKRTRCL